MEVLIFLALLYTLTVVDGLPIMKSKDCKIPPRQWLPAPGKIKKNIILTIKKCNR